MLSRSDAMPTTKSWIFCACGICSIVAAPIALALAAICCSRLGSIADAVASVPSAPNACSNGAPLASATLLPPLPALAAAPISVPSWSISEQISASPMRSMPFSAASISALTFESSDLTTAMPRQTNLTIVVLHLSPCDWMRPQMLSRPPRIASRHLAILRAVLTGSVDPALKASTIVTAMLLMSPTPFR